MKTRAVLSLVTVYTSTLWFTTYNASGQDSPNTISGESSSHPLPVIHTPDSLIAEVFRGNWENTLKPCQLQDTNPQKRPWMVDARNHYKDWYPGIDFKYGVRAYLFCEKNLQLVLTGWQHTVGNCQLPNGGVQSTEMKNNPGTAYAFISKDKTRITYALRASGTIDLLLVGDMIYRFTQDHTWLKDNIEYLRRAAHWLETWIDDEGMLDSEDYDHDSLMRRGTEGTAQASCYMAFMKLAALENILGNIENRDHCEKVANKLANGAKKHLWDSQLGYFYEFAERNNIACKNRLGSIGGVSSESGPKNSAMNAIDGILGYGMDVVRIGGAEGQSEWAANSETAGAWIKINLKTPTAVNRVMLYNRQSSSATLSETFATGHLDFSDGSTVQVEFESGLGSRAVVPFASRTVDWVRFTGDKMQAEGRGNAGLAEFEIHPTNELYLKYTHGMSDVNFAMVGYGLADDKQSRAIWKYFKSHEDAFYTYNNVHCPTWTAELPDSYTDDELNSINPDKDRTALARVWRHDLWMRKRMQDGEGINKTIQFAIQMYFRPSGGGIGVFGERYDLGRFTPGDDGEDSTPAYAEYPAEYNATAIGEVLLGITVDVFGTINISPCVPARWFKAGFGIENPGILKDRDLGYSYSSNRITGWIRGKEGNQAMRILIPSETKTVHVLQDGKEIPFKQSNEYVSFHLSITNEKNHEFIIE